MTAGGATGAGDDEAGRRGPAERTEQEDTMAIGADAQVAQYLEGVRRALADLPEPTRRELLEDLAEHLAEVAAEAEGTLVERLGPPAGYAAELRASAGVPPAPGGGPAPAVAAGLARLRAAGRSVDLRVGALLGYPTGTAFARLLRPGWWVLRGYLAAVVLWTVFMGHGLSLSGPPGWRMAYLVAVALAIWLSIRLGQRPPARQLFGRAATTAANALLPVLFLLVWASSPPQAAAVGVSFEDPYAHLQIYPYGPDGQPLRDVRLVDQYGNLVAVGDGRTCPEGPGDWPVRGGNPQDPGAESPVRPYPGLPDPAPPIPVLPACGLVHPFPSVPPLPRDAGAGPSPSTGGAPPATAAAPSATAAAPSPPAPSLTGTPPAAGPAGGSD
ncbi:MAG TPA: hypothetical protein VNV66_06120 [Pilimelia sp.]|nr:hypothetical protein [Pilimelia sp.]